MKRPIRKRLTKEMLEEWGIKDFIYDKKTNQWTVIRLWKVPGHSKKIVEKEIHPSLTVARHKYGRDIYYYMIAMSINGKTVGYGLHRALYAWFYGEVPEGYDIAHMNNDSLDNRLENLECMTHEENLRMRYERYGLYSNQYKNSTNKRKDS